MDEQENRTGGRILLHAEENHITSPPAARPAGRAKTTRRIGGRKGKRNGEVGNMDGRRGGKTGEDK